MKTLVATFTTVLFLITSQSAFAFSIKISSIKKHPAVASIVTAKGLETLTLDVPAPLPDLSASFISDPVIAIDDTINTFSIDPALTNASAVPVPAAAWLLGSGLIGLFGFSKRQFSEQLGGS